MDRIEEGLDVDLAFNAFSVGIHLYESSGESF